MIRAAAAHDLNDLCQLWLELSLCHAKLSPYFALAPDCEEKYRQYLLPLLSNSAYGIFVWEIEGQIIGMVIAALEERPNVYQTSTLGFIQEITVKSAYRRQGIGQKLFEQAIKWLKAQGVKEINCHYAPANPSSSTFWQKLGFKPVVITAIRSLEN